MNNGTTLAGNMLWKPLVKFSLFGLSVRRVLWKQSPFSRMEVVTGPDTFIHTVNNKSQAVREQSTGALARSAEQAVSSQQQ